MFYLFSAFMPPVYMLKVKSYWIPRDLSWPAYYIEFLVYGLSHVLEWKICT